MMMSIGLSQEPAPVKDFQEDGMRKMMKSLMRMLRRGEPATSSVQRNGL